MPSLVDIRARALAQLRTQPATTGGFVPVLNRAVARIIPFPAQAAAPGTVPAGAPLAVPAPDTQAATAATTYGDGAGSFTAPAASSVDELTPPDPAATATPAAPGISPLLIVGGLVVAWLVFGRKH
jgi:hypothetical protein